MKKKNVLILYLNFLPHLAFWLIAAFGYVRYASYAGLALALLVSLATWKVCGLAPLVYFNLLFFAIAATASLTMGTSIEKRLPNLMSGEFVSLLLMSFYTILFEGQPFFLDFASRDYPESMHYNPLFRRTYSWLTYVWTACFAAGLGVSAFSLLTLSGETARMVPAVTCSVMLVVLAVTTSVVIMLMPRFFGRHLLAKSNLKGTWTAPTLDPDRKLRESEFDVAVIGAGIGGLTCAAMLAKAGLKVLLAEQRKQVGGYCSSVTRDGFVLNVGPTVFTGVREGGALSLLLENLGIRDRVPFARPTLGAITDANAMRITDNVESYINKLITKFPGDEEGLLRFLTDLRSFRGELNDHKEPGLPILVEDLEDFNEQFYAYPIISKWHNLNAAQMLYEYFGDPALRDLFSCLLFPVAGDPSAISAYDAGYLYKEMLLDGCGFPVGGLRPFTGLLSRACHGFGVTVLTDCMVEKIMLKDTSSGPRIVGLKMEDGSQHRCQMVVMSGDPAQLTHDLLPPDALGSKYRKKLAEMQPSNSFQVLFLGVEGDLDIPDRVFLTTDKPRRIRTGNTYLEIKHLTISLLSRQDPSLAPAGTHLLNVWAAVPGKCYDAFTGETNRKGLEEALTLAIKQDLRRIIPRIDQRIVFQERLSPLHLNKLTLNTRGAAFGYQPSLEQHLFHRPDIHTPFHNLYLSGAWGRYGLGMEGAVVNSMLVARHILAGGGEVPVEAEPPILEAEESGRESRRRRGKSKAKIEA